MVKLSAASLRFFKEEEGLGTLEMLLIVAVLVAMAIVFRKWILAWFHKLLGDANSDLQNNGSVPVCVPGPTTSCAPAN